MMLSNFSNSNAMNVILPPTNNDIYNYPSSEPQRITLRQPNSAVITLDTFDSSTRNPYSFSGNRLVLGGMKRFAATDLNILWSGLNVNSTNNLLRFTYSNSSFETIIPPGSYTNPKKIMDALASAMNSSIGSVVMTWTDDNLLPGFGRLASNNSWGFLDCPAVKYGKHLWNLPIQAPTTSLFIGQIGLIYTRWIDVISEGLTQYVKNPNTSTSSNFYPSPGNLVGRFHITFPQYEAGYKEISRRIQAFQNFEITNDLQQLDISFRDEWGNPLFLSPNGDIALDIYCEC